MAETVSTSVLELGVGHAKYDKDLDAAQARFKAFAGKIRDEGKTAAGFGQSLSQSLLGTHKPLDTTHQKLGAIWSGLKGAAGLVGVTFGAAAVVSFTKHVFDAASAIKDQAAAIGFSAEAFQRNKFAVEQSGGSMEGFTKAAGTLNDKLAEGSSSTIAALKRAGLEFEHIRSLKPEQAWAAVTDAVGKIPDPMLRANVAQDLFGKGARELLPGMIEGYQKLGAGVTVMSDDTINRLEEAQDALDAFGNSLTILAGETIGGFMRDSSAAMSGFAKLWGDIKATATGGLQGHRDYIATLGQQQQAEASAKQATEARTAATRTATAGTKAQEEADRKAAAAAKAHADRIHEFAAGFSGAKLAERVRDVFAAYQQLTPEQRKNEDTQRRVTDEVMRLAKEGATLPPVLAAIWREAAIADFNNLKLVGSFKLLKNGVDALIARRPPPVLDPKLYQAGADMARLQLVPAWQEINAGQLVAERNATLVGKAWQTLGLTSKQSLLDQVDAARDAYADILRYGDGNADDLIAARKRIEEAEIAAGLRTVSFWKTQVGPQLLGVFRQVTSSLSAAILGLSGRTHDEHQRQADDATKSHEQTQQRVRDQLKKTEQQARQSYEDTAKEAKDSYEQTKADAFAAYQAIVQKDGVTKEELEAAERQYQAVVAEAAREADEKIASAHEQMTTDITAASKQSNEEIEASHKAMQAAIEQASHKWKDNLVDIWNSLKQSAINVMQGILDHFLNNLLRGMLGALTGQQGAFGGLWSSLFSVGGSGAGGVGTEINLTNPASMTAGGAAAGNAWAAGLAQGLGAGAAAYGLYSFWDHLISRWTGGPSPERMDRLIGYQDGDPNQPVFAPGIEEDEYIERYGTPGQNPNAPIDPETGEAVSEFDEGQNTPNYKSGTDDLDYENFGPRRRINAHDWEAIIPRGRGHELAAEIAAAMPVRTDTRHNERMNIDGITRGIQAALAPMVTNLSRSYGPIDVKVYLGSRQIEALAIETNLRAVERNDGGGASVGPTDRYAQALAPRLRPLLGLS